MKKLLFALGLSAAAVAFVPGTVSAHGYGQDTEEDTDYSQSEQWQSNRCDRIDYRLDNLNTMFDQDSDRRLDRQQRLIDRSNEAECPVDGTVVDTLVDNGNFTTLVAAVQAAGLADALSAPGPITVFAPTDQAFAKLPAGTVEALLADIPTLTTILTNHVVSGSVDAETAASLSSAMALSGNQLNISTDDWGNLYINDARVVLSDIHTSNGIVHVIDTVLVP